jgi:hypothetical protein
VGDTELHELFHDGLCWNRDGDGLRLDHSFR